MTNKNVGLDSPVTIIMLPYIPDLLQSIYSYNDHVTPSINIIYIHVYNSTRNK